MKKLNQTTKIVILSVLALVLGIGGGFLLKGKPPTTTADGGVTSDGQNITAVVADDTSQIKKGDVFGSNDETVFKDNAQGFLEAGGLDGEGSHALLRPGGVSQTVYLTSSVTDLDSFVGMDIKVWGETFKGQKAGWLMDVGRVEVVNTQGENPNE